MPQVKLPNGTELSFPEGMSEDAMREAIGRNFPEYAAPDRANADRDPDAPEAPLPTADAKRTEHELYLRSLNPGANPDLIAEGMRQFDATQASATKAAGSRVERRFKTLASPEDTFNERLNQKLQGGQDGIVPELPANAQPRELTTYRPRPGMLDQAAGDFGRGIDNLRALGYGAGGLAADAVGEDQKSTDLLNHYVAIQNDIAKNNPATIGTYKNVHDMGDAGRYAIEAVMENLPMILPSLVTGGVGAKAAQAGAQRLVTGMVEEQVAAGIARSVAERNAAQFVMRRVMLGSAAGAAPATIGMEAGSIMGDIYQDTGQKHAGLAIGYGIPAGLLDTLEPVLALRKIAGPAVDQLAGSIIKRLGVEAGKQFITEAGTEGLQTMLEEGAKAQASGKKYWTPELFDGVVDSALKGGIGGAGIGMASEGVHALRGKLAELGADPAADAAEAARQAALTSWRTNGLSNPAAPAPRLSDIANAGSVSDAIDAARAIVTRPMTPHATAADIDALETGTSMPGAGGKNLPVQGAPDLPPGAQSAPVLDPTGKELANLGKLPVSRVNNLEGIDLTAGVTFNDDLPLPAAPAAPAAPTPQRDAIDKIIDPAADWHAFPAETGTLGIPRAEMPQIKAEHRGAMTQFLNARGIPHEQVEVPAESLKPTQAEFSLDKVTKAMEYEGGNRSILVSSDGYVLDGHHQWLAAVDANAPVKAIRLAAPIAQLLDTVREFPSATVAEGANQVQPASKAATPSGVIDLAISEIRRKNGAIGTQGVTESQVRGVLEHAAGMTVDASATMREMVDALKADKQAQARLREFMEQHPLQAHELPDGSIQINDAHHRAFLLNQLGDTTIPAQVNDYTGPSQRRTEATAPTAQPTSHLDAARTKHERQDAAVRQAVENAAKRKVSGGQRARDRVHAENGFLGFLATHGINLQAKADTGMERGKLGNPLVPGFGPLFRRTGLHLDELALAAQQAGFLTQHDVDSDTDTGGTRKLSELIQRAVQGKEVIRRAGDESGTPTADRQLYDEAQSLGIETDGKTPDQVYDEVVAAHADHEQHREHTGAATVDQQAEVERLADTFTEQEQQLAAELDADINLSAGRPMNDLTDKEIDEIFGIQSATKHARDDGSETQEGAAAPAPGSPEGTGQPLAVRQDLLTDYTRADVVERQDAAAARTKSTAKERARIEALRTKDQGDKETRARMDASAENFQLGQSADEALSGQKDIFTAKDRKSAPYHPDLFGGQDLFDDIPVRPGTLEAQKDAGRAAVSDLARRLGIDRINRRNNPGGSDVSVLGSRLLANFVAGKPNQLVGQKVATAHDLAVLAQVYRDPRFETFRVFYMKRGAIVGEAGYTSRLPAAVHMPPDMAAQMLSDSVRFGADGYYILHNHPSGHAAPSAADEHLTRHIDKAVPGFLGHVVVDHNEYAVIQNWGSKVFQAPELNGKSFSSIPEIEHALLGVKLNSPQTVALAAKALQIKDGFATLILTTAPGEVNLLVDIPIGALAGAKGFDGRSKTKALVRRMARESGAGGHRFLILPNDSMQFTPYLHMLADGILTDIVKPNGESAQEKGAFYGGNFMDRGKKKSIRVGEDKQDSAAPDEDDGGDIPRAFFKKVKVPHEVWIEDEARFETVDIPANKALTSVRADIEHLQGLIECMGG